MDIASWEPWWPCWGLVGRVSWRHLVHRWHNFVPAVEPSAFCFIIFHVNFQDYTIPLIDGTQRITQIMQIIRIWTLCAAGECCLWRAQGKSGTSPGRWGGRSRLWHGITGFYLRFGCSAGAGAGTWDAAGCHRSWQEPVCHTKRAQFFFEALFALFDKLGPAMPCISKEP